MLSYQRLDLSFQVVTSRFAHACRFACPAPRLNRGPERLRVNTVYHLSGQPVFITEGRTRAAAGQLFDALGPQRSAEVAVVTMDMAAPYIEEVKARAPNAEIAFDPFHVVKLANEAVQEVRRSELRELSGQGDPAAQVLKDARWSLLRRKAGTPARSSVISQARTQALSPAQS